MHVSLRRSVLTYHWILKTVLELQAHLIETNATERVSEDTVTIMSQLYNCSLKAKKVKLLQCFKIRLSSKDFLKVVLKTKHSKYMEIRITLFQVGILLLAVSLPV